MKKLYMVVSNDFENARFFNNIFEAIETMNEGSVLYRKIEASEYSTITYQEVDFEDREFIKASQIIEKQRERKQRTNAALLKFLNIVEEMKADAIEF